MYGCALSRESQNPSTTGWVLNGFFGSIKRGVLQPYQKGGVVDLFKVLLPARQPIQADGSLQTPQYARSGQALINTIVKGRRTR